VSDIVRKRAGEILDCLPVEDRAYLDEHIEVLKDEAASQGRAAARRRGFGVLFLEYSLIALIVGVGVGVMSMPLVVAALDHDCDCPTAAVVEEP